MALPILIGGTRFVIFPELDGVSVIAQNGNARGQGITGVLVAGRNGKAVAAVRDFRLAEDVELFVSGCHT